MWEKRNNLKVKKGAPPTKGAQKTKWFIYYPKNNLK
jgi:hypothetical protein